MASHPVRPPEWIDSAALIVDESVVIDAPPSAVWPHIADHESWPEWFEALKKVERIGAGVGVGSGRRVFVPGMAIDEEFTAWDENEHFAFAVIGSKAPVLASLAESVRLEPVGDTQCRVTYRQGIEGRRGFGWLVTSVWKQAAKSLPDALAALKSRVESE